MKHRLKLYVRWVPTTEGQGLERTALEANEAAARAGNDPRSSHQGAEHGPGEDWLILNKGSLTPMSG
jgi:hypothetical protein